MMRTIIEKSEISRAIQAIKSAGISYKVKIEDNSKESSEENIDETLDTATENLKDDIINEISVEASETIEVVPKQFNGYISSFGASVIQSGLIPSVIFFEDETARPEEKRTLLIEAIKLYLGETGKLSEKLLLLNADDDIFAQEENILEAAQAIKLALRTFKKSGQ